MGYSDGLVQTQKSTGHSVTDRVVRITYINTKLLKTESTQHLRDLTAEEGVPAENQKLFEVNLVLIAIVLAYIAARRTQPIRIADAILTSALRAWLSDGEASTISAATARVDRYRSLCPSGSSEPEELAALTLLACDDLYDDTEDMLFMGSVTVWVSGTLRVFEKFLRAVQVRPGD